MRTPDAPADKDVSRAADERGLLAGLRAGDKAAFEQLVRTYGGRLLAVAKRYLRNEEEAQDAVQEAFLSAFRAIKTFEEGSHGSQRGSTASLSMLH